MVVVVVVEHAITVEKRVTYPVTVHRAAVVS
jgi:hypothetical protein